MFLRYVLKIIIKGILNPSFADKSDIFKGLRFYKSVKGKKKSVIKVYSECKYI